MNSTMTLSPLLLKISAFRKSLTKSEQKVVDYICEYPNDVIHLSVAGLASNCGTSEATVVRTCRKIGLDGYQDLKVSLAQDIVTPLQSIHEEINENDDIKSITDKVFQSTLQTIEYTHSIIDYTAIEKAAETILNSKRIIVIGLGNSHAIAVDFFHKLLRLKLDAQAVCDSHIQAIISSALTEKDCLIAISQSGSSKDIIESTKIAKERGAATISLTDIEPSPLNKLADINLYTASRETAYRILGMRSRVGQMIVIDSIYTIMSTRTRNASLYFHDIEKALVPKKY